MRASVGFGLSVLVLSGVACSEKPDGTVGDSGRGGSGASGGTSGGAGMGSGGAGRAALGGSAGNMPSAGMAGLAGAAPAGGAGSGGSAGSPPLAGNGGSAGASNPAGGVGAGGAAGGGMSGTGPSAGSGGAAGEPSKYGAKYPFPQNLRAANCSYPTMPDSSKVRDAYDAWKMEIVTSNGAGGHLRTQRPNSPGAETNSTVSEGIAYGMLIAVFMDDRDLFDELWKYEQLWVNGNGLMDWYINAAGTSRLGTGGATDADEDMAWALVMADRQWGGKGTLDKPYLDHAKTLIKAIWDHEIDHQNKDFLLAGDSWQGNLIFNASYFAPNEYRVFGEVTGDTAGWGRVIDTGYTILAKSLNAQSKNADNGLVPAWCDANGAPKSPDNGGATNYQYDSARIPFRIGLDYCWSGESRAKDYLAKVSQFFAGVGASKIVDGYDLDGKPHPDPDSDPNGPQSAVFVGSAAVGAMHDATFQSFVSDAYGLVATGDLLARSRYYNHSWTTLTLGMLTGVMAEYPAQ
ncbi:MAG TPA: glycosyl hydrolase family 8 [Polyangiaceae bacterium]|nr:glycosyl hydrolase family 8 [Polyangiaceae bacterium]